MWPCRPVKINNMSANCTELYFIHIFSCDCSYDTAKMKKSAICLNSHSWFLQAQSHIRMHKFQVTYHMAPHFHSLNISWFMPFCLESKFSSQLSQICELLVPSTIASSSTNHAFCEEIFSWFTNNSQKSWNFRPQKFGAIIWYRVKSSVVI